MPKKSTIEPQDDDTSGFITGFGASSETNRFNDFLWNSELDLYNISMCSVLDSTKPKNANTQICAGTYSSFSNMTASCMADYGSALYIEDDIYGKDKFIAVGLFSYSNGCGQRHSPGIYTRISSYTDWIHEKMSEG